MSPKIEQDITKWNNYDMIKKRPILYQKKRKMKLDIQIQT